MNRKWLGLITIVVIGAGAATFAVMRSDGGSRLDANDAALVTLGSDVYANHCAQCHGAQLEGQPDWRTRLPNGRLPAPPHDASGHTWHHPDAILFQITKDGIEAVAPPGYASDMPAFGDVLSDHEIRAVLSYIKSQWPPEIRARQETLNKP